MVNFEAMEWKIHLFYSQIYFFSIKASNDTENNSKYLILKMHESFYNWTITTGMKGSHNQLWWFFCMLSASEYFYFEFGVKTNT